MTDEEHQTRAMLLGMEWNKAMRIYAKNKYSYGIDQDTMEPISREEWIDRYWASEDG